MKAARFHSTGGVEVLRFEDVPDPKPGPGDVVVAVRAAALNRMDIFLRSGSATMPGLTLPHIGGFDIAGEVAEVGDGVDPKRIGEAVIVKARVTGPKSRGRLDIIGTARPGGFAEKVLVPEVCLAPKPPNYSFEEAAAFGCVYLTAYYSLIDQVKVQPGETVLVHAAGSGAGSAAIQVAKALGATVITTAGSDEKCAKAKQLLGADYVVNYKAEDFSKFINGFTSGRGVDVVFDPVWGSTVPQTLKVLGYRSRWIVLGMIGGVEATVNVARLMFREVTIRGIIEFYADEVQIDGALEMARKGLVKPIISKVWPLRDLAAAQKQMEDGNFFGKIVVVP